MNCVSVKHWTMEVNIRRPHVIDALKHVAIRADVSGTDERPTGLD